MQWRHTVIACVVARQRNRSIDRRMQHKNCLQSRSNNITDLRTREAHYTDEMILFYSHKVSVKEFW
jgi:hypothetical protein